MENQELFNTIRNLPIFHGLSDSVVTKLCGMSGEVRVARDEMVFREDEPVDAIYVILSGEAGVLRKVEEGEFKSLGIIARGELFGEMGLFEQNRRTASIIARKDLHLLRIGVSDFQALLREDSESASKMFFELLVVLSRRLRETSREQVALFETGRAIAACSSIDELVEKVFEIIINVIPSADSGFMALYNQYNDILEIRASKGLFQDELQTGTVSQKEPIVQILRKSKQFHEGNPAKEELFEGGRFSHAQSVIACPLYSGENFIGIVMLFDHSMECAFTPAQRNLLTGICSQFAPAVENAAFRKDDMNRLRLKRVRI